MVGLTLHVQQLSAQQRDNARFQGVDPAQFLEQSFGKETERDRAVLARIEVSVREEQQFGNRLANAYLQQLKQSGLGVTSRDDDVKYLRQLVDGVRPMMLNRRRYRKIRIYVVHSDRLDACSFPGGTLVFFRGILDFAESEAALVGVIGHELSHVDRGHQLRPVRRAKLTQQAYARRSNISQQQFIDSRLTVLRSFSRPFRPEEESVADRDGAMWAWQAGYDPREMAKLFQRMHERKTTNGGAPVFRSHPYHDQRHQAIMSAYDEFQAERPKDNLFLGRENLKQRRARPTN